MELMPILRALSRNKFGAILIATQVAITMTIMVNAVFIIQERQTLMSRPSGVDEMNTFYITSTGFADNYNEEAVIEEDLNRLRKTPGVVDAIQTNMIPLSGSGWSMGLQTKPGAGIEGISAAVYMVDEHAINTFGINLIAGENFKSSDIMVRRKSQSTWADKIIVTKAMAESLFPEDWQAAVGNTVYINDTEPMTIIGVVEQLQGSWVSWDKVENSILVPERTYFGSTIYLIRTEPGLRDELMPQIEEMLATSEKGRLLRRMRTMEETRKRSYEGDTAMSRILTAVIIALLGITSLGIVGLASFSVNRRRKQIGTRRALGASRSHILSYFMLENFLITTVGVCFGAVLTLGLNMVLVQVLKVAPMAWYYVPIGMVILWIISQLAVFGPARKATLISPAIATRTV